MSQPSRRGIGNPSESAGVRLLEQPRKRTEPPGDRRIAAVPETQNRVHNGTEVDGAAWIATLQGENSQPEVTFPRGHVIFDEGEPADRLYIIQTGMVKLGRKSPDGKENLLSIMGPSDMFGELSIFDPGPRTSTATTVTDVRALTMDRPALRQWLRIRPEIAEQLLRVVAGRLRRTNTMLGDLIFTDVPGRVAKALLELAQRFGSREAGLLRVTHDLTQAEIAQYIGASRETVNKALNDFAQRGWLRLAGRSVLILDFERLARRSRSGFAASGRVATNGACSTRSAPSGVATMNADATLNPPLDYGVDRASPGAGG